LLEAHVIQTKAFKNVGDGFQVAVRCPYYRGIWASLLEEAQVTVDGETFATDDVRWTLGGESYSAAELAASDGLRWPFEEPAILTVEKAGGLEPGLHDVEVAITWRWSYIPEEMQPTTNISTRKLVLTS
jgi:hypothetical protein